jgi:GBP family porin
MKKSLIALAALGTLSAGAFAQSSVTIYGKVDLGLVVDSGSPSGKAVRLSSPAAGSRLGFKGVEDLGGGYKAAFILETGVCVDSAAGAPNFCTGSNQFFGRQAHGDLSGSFGTLSAGRQFSQGYNTLAIVDPFQLGYAGQTINTDGKGTFVGDNSGARLNNSVTYMTPVVANFTAAAEISLGETTGNFKGGRELGGSVNYSNGPAFASVTYYNLDNPDGSGTNHAVTTAAGVYDFGVVKAHALIQKVTGHPTGAATVDIVNMLVGATVPLGTAGRVIGSFIHHDDRTAADKDTNQLGLGYVYPLSRKTSTYVAWARNQNRHNAGFLIGNGTEAGTGNQSFNLGFTINF